MYLFYIHLTYRISFADVKNGATNKTVNIKAWVNYNEQQNYNSSLGFFFFAHHYFEYYWFKCKISNVYIFKYLTEIPNWIDMVLSVHQISWIS